MRLRQLAVALLLSAALPAMAETLACPKLSNAVQVGVCPTEEELKYTFNGFCSDNARMYAKDTEPCTDYSAYRRLKNIATWESADGAFSGYVSCDLPAASVKAATASRIAVVKQGKISQLICTYGEGITLSYRTRTECKVEGDGNCAAGSSCKASCD